MSSDDDHNNHPGDRKKEILLPVPHGFFDEDNAFLPPVSGSIRSEAPLVPVSGPLTGTEKKQNIN